MLLLTHRERGRESAILALVTIRGFVSRNERGIEANILMIKTKRNVPRPNSKARLWRFFISLYFFSSFFSSNCRLSFLVISVFLFYFYLLFFVMIRSGRDRFINTYHRLVGILPIVPTWCMVIKSIPLHTNKVTDKPLPRAKWPIHHPSGSFIIEESLFESSREIVIQFRKLCFVCVMASGLSLAKRSFRTCLLKV